MSNLPSAPEFGSAPQYPIESVDNALRVVLLGEMLPAAAEVSHVAIDNVSSAVDVVRHLVGQGRQRQDPPGRGHAGTAGCGPRPNSEAAAILVDSDQLASGTVHRPGRPPAAGSSGAWLGAPPAAARAACLSNSPASRATR